MTKPRRLSAEYMRQVLRDEMSQQEQNRASTGTGNPLPTGTPGSVDGRAIIRLKVADVGIYDKNPRQRLNPKRDEIMQSIVARGLDQQLAVTKRPGSSHYVLARGGNTRLSILQDLAQQDPGRFEYLDFDLVDFKAESDLLAGHMVENLARSDMSFWDTANSYLELRKLRSRELGREISLRDFSKELQQQGFKKIDSVALADCQFLIDVLSEYAGCAVDLGVRDVRNTLRPQHTRICELSARLRGPESDPSAALAYGHWLARFAGERSGQRDPSVEADPEVATSLGAELAEHIHRCAAEWLELSSHELQFLLDALRDDPDLAANDLNARRVALSAAPTRSGEQPGSDLDLPFSAPANSQAAAVQVGFEPGPDAGRDADEDVVAPLPRALQDEARTPAALLGVVTAPDHLLRKLNPDGYVAGQPATANDELFGTMALANQATLPGTTSMEAAEARMRQCITELAEFAAISAVLREARGMPLGFFMDTPSAPLGGAPNDYAVQAWWFLSTLSGQLTEHFFNLSAADEQGNSALVLYDTGPMGFRERVQDEALWTQFIATHLGGIYQADGIHVLELLTNIGNPVGQHGREIIKAVSAYRLLKAQGAGS
jgi:hypothetical protein